MMTAPSCASCPCAASHRVHVLCLQQPAATSAPKRKAGKAKVAKPAAAAGTPSTPARERIPRHAKQLAEGKLAEGPSSGDEDEDADHHDQAPSDDDDGSSDHGMHTHTLARCHCC